MADIHQKIVPHLWFEHQAAEAVHYYVSLFPESELTGSVVLPATPSGDAEVFSFTLLGSRFMAINGGPSFRINPSVSFFVYCGSDREIERLYDELSRDGEVMFPLDSYPWARRYAFIQDRFGVAWQVVPTEMNDLMFQSGSEKLERILRVMLPMIKLDLEALRNA